MAMWLQPDPLASIYELCSKDTLYARVSGFEDKFLMFVRAPRQTTAKAYTSLDEAKRAAEALLRKYRKHLFKEMTTIDALLER